MAGENILAAEPFDRGVEQNLLQRAAMDRELRPLVAGLDTAWFAPDRLAMFRKISELAGAYSRRVEPIVQAEFDQLAHRMRQHIDADAERF